MKEEISSFGPIGTDRPKIFDLLKDCGFSGVDYVQYYQDLFTNLPLDDESGIEHFVKFGVNEGRICPLSLQWDAFQRLSYLAISGGVDVVPLLESLSIAHMRPFSGELKMWRHAQSRSIGEFAKAGGSPVLIFGDSHAILYAVRKPRSGSNWLVPIDLRCVGASARGLAKVPSTSGNGAEIRRFVTTSAQAIKDAAAVLFKFGQVDLEFVYYYNVLTQNSEATFDEGHFLSFIAETVDRYVGFMEELFLKQDRSHISITSVFPPSLSDEEWATGYLKAHIGIAEGGAKYSSAADALSRGLDPDPVLSKLIRNFTAPSITVRTEMHRAYNRVLKERSEAAGFAFLNDFDAFLGPEGLIDPAFTKIQQGRDHHIDESSASYERIAEVLWGHVKSRAGGKPT